MINKCKNTLMAAFLGITFLGSLVVPQQATAQNLVQKAQAGDASAQYRLAVSYFTGQGVQADMDQAYTWARKAADQGHAEAQGMVGIMYAQGKGVEKDLEEAAYWYELAAEQGNMDAQYMLGIYSATGTGVTLNFSNAAKWFAQAAAQGDARGLGQLGYLFKTGQGVRESKVIAFALLTLSEANNPSPENKAIANRKDLITGMSSEELAAGKKLTSELVEPDNFTNALKKAYSAL